jgi:hypothetical protein
MEIEGLRQLERKLDRLAKTGSKKVARAAMTGAVAPIRKAIRQQVNGATASAGLKRSARKTIGSKVKKQPGGEYGAKVGFGVGKPTKKKRAAATARAGSSKSGVGVSAANIHWFVLGTKDRTTKTGRSTGRTEAVLEGLVPAAVSSSKTASLNEAASKAKAALLKEAKKRS